MLLMATDTQSEHNVWAHTAFMLSEANYILTQVTSNAELSCQESYSQTNSMLILNS